MNRRMLMLPLVALFGAIVGFFVGAQMTVAPARLPSEPVRPPAKRAIAGTDGRNVEDTLRARIASLERALADARRPVRTSTNAVETADAELRRPRDRRNPMRAEMERLRKENPERFAQMTNFWARARATRAAQEQSRRAFLASLSTDAMSAEEGQVHESLQEALVLREQISEQLRSEDLTDDERRELFDSLRETDRSIRELGKKERDTLLRQTASALGCDEDTTTDFLETVKAIFDSTEGARGPGGGMPPPPMPQGGTPGPQ